jgi:hypothetical protein
MELRSNDFKRNNIQMNITSSNKKCMDTTYRSGNFRNSSTFQSNRKSMYMINSRNA